MMSFVISYAATFNFPCGVSNFLIKKNLVLKEKTTREIRKEKKTRKLSLCKTHGFLHPDSLLPLLALFFSVWLLQVFFAPFKGRKKILSEYGPFCTPT